MIWNQIFKQLCELCRKIAELATALGDMPQVEGLHMIRWCTTAEDGTQTTTGWSSTVIDENTGTPTTYYFDAAMQPIAVAPEGEPCVPEPEEACFPIQGCNADGLPVIKFITKDGTVVSEVIAETLGFGECVCPASGGVTLEQCATVSTSTYSEPDGSPGLDITGAGTSNHTAKISKVPAAAVTEINGAIAAGNFVELTFTDSAGVILGVFSAEAVSGVASSTASFVLTGTNALNTCGSSTARNTTAAGGSAWATVDVKIIQS